MQECDNLELMQVVPEIGGVVSLLGQEAVQGGRHLVLSCARALLHSIQLILPYGTMS